MYHKTPKILEKRAAWKGGAVCLFLLLLALLVCDAAAGFARGLARGLALAAAAFFRAGAKIAGFQGLDSFHGIELRSVKFGRNVPPCRRALDLTKKFSIQWQQSQGLCSSYHSVNFLKDNLHL
jgi:hypothetical protein